MTQRSNFSCSARSSRVVPVKRLAYLRRFRQATPVDRTKWSYPETHDLISRAFSWKVAKPKAVYDENLVEVACAVGKLLL